MYRLHMSLHAHIYVSASVDHRLGPFFHACSYHTARPKCEILCHANLPSRARREGGDLMSSHHSRSHPPLLAPACHQHTVAPSWTGAYLQLNNVSLSPCVWDGNQQACRSPLIASDPNSEVVSAMATALSTCPSPVERHPNSGWFKDVPRNGVDARMGPRAASKASVDVALLFDTWGTMSLYHSVVDTLFTASTTIHAQFGHHDACVNGHRSCAAFVIHRHNWAAETPFAQEIAKLLFGPLGIRQGNQIPAAVYPMVLVGSLMQAYTPVKWPDYKLPQMRYHPLMQPAWHGFIDTLHSQLLLQGVVSRAASAPAPQDGTGTGVWLRRGATPPTEKQQRRHLLPEEVAALQATTSPWLRVASTGEMTFAQQATMMRSATLMAGLEGAGFVNQLLMPPGGTTVLISPWLDGPPGWQWAYGQYHARRLVYVDLKTARLSVPLVQAVGRLLNAVQYNCPLPLPSLPGGAVILQSGEPIGPPNLSRCRSLDGPVAQPAERAARPNSPRHVDRRGAHSSAAQKDASDSAAKHAPNGAAKHRSGGNHTHHASNRTDTGSSSSAATRGFGWPWA